MTAPALGNIQQDSSSNAAPSVTKPTGLSNDDLMILIVAGDQANKSSPEYTWPTGADAFIEIGQDGDGTSDCHLGAAYRIVDGGESATFTVTPVNDGSQFDIWAIAVTGAHATTPLDVTGTITMENTGSMDILSVTTTVNDCLAFYALAFDGGDGAPFGQPTGWVEQAEGVFTLNSEVGSAWGTKTQALSGATDDATVSASATDGVAHFQFAIAPAVAGAADEYVPTLPQRIVRHTGRFMCMRESGLLVPKPLSVCRKLVSIPSGKLFRTTKKTLAPVS